MNISSLQPLKAWLFNYPVIDTPNLLVKLGERATNGVGPDGDIVAYSMICQHAGGYVGFHPTGEKPPCAAPLAPMPEGYCCLHGGAYDFTKGAAVIKEPPPRPLPQVKLDYDSATGDIYAVEMGPPIIFTKIPSSGVNPNDPSQALPYDLRGGEIVTQDTVSAKEL